MVNEPGNFGDEAVLVPAGVALRPEEHGALIIVYAVDGVAQFAAEIRAHLGADQAGGAGD